MLEKTAEATNTKAALYEQAYDTGTKLMVMAGAASILLIMTIMTDLGPAQTFHLKFSKN